MDSSRRSLVPLRIRTTPANDTRAIRDALVASAISAMQADIGAEWTVERLARAVGTSRPTLARRFAASLGTPPLKYLTRLRLEHTARLLVIDRRPLAEIATEVGYATEFALSRAFRRHFGIAPGRFRAHVASAGVGRPMALAA